MKATGGTVFKRHTSALDRPGGTLSLRPSHIAKGRESISAGELLDACLYELGALELADDSKQILIEEMALEGDIPCGSDADKAGFREVVARVFGLIPATREYQMALTV